MPSRAIALAALALVTFAAGCSRSAQFAGMSVTGGDPNRGRAAIGRYGCGSCHTIDGVSGAHGLVGPPLTGVGARLYIAGVLRNTPDNMITWIRNPKAVDEKTAMPVLGVSDGDAADIAAYLYAIR
jgi:cytochrome c